MFSRLGETSSPKRDGLLAQNWSSSLERQHAQELGRVSNTLA